MTKKKHVLNEDQLAMFIPAHKLMDAIPLDQPATRRPLTLRNLPDVASRKIKEAKRDGLYDEIKSEGVQTPITIGQHPMRVRSGRVYDYFPGANYEGPVIEDGHHRISVANSIDPKMEIPVKYASPNDDLSD
ncbi:hypothetical protein UFOVP1130_134 [uncultured Caudovirales phage]|uniref:ParB/Sulfiredoxin n=1 Tax=uncultured Caudovirales phage TaxID=2100421 RepID=A0A6J5QTE5_9CAUD|nr:hypothetical protein UFOVP1130_134 [uncultured Caudovirales phage]